MNGVNTSLASGVAMETKGAAKDATEDEGPPVVFVAFARIYSGTVKKGQTLYVLGPKHDPSQVADYVSDTLPQLVQDAYTVTPGNFHHSVTFTIFSPRDRKRIWKGVENVKKKEK